RSGSGRERRRAAGTRPAEGTGRTPGVGLLPLAGPPEGRAMRWREGRRSQNVEDRRGQRMPGGGGGLRIGGGGLLLMLLVMWLLGADPMTLLSMLAGGGGGSVTQVDPRGYETGAPAPQTGGP